MLGVIMHCTGVEWGKGWWRGFYLEHLVAIVSDIFDSRVNFQFSTFLLDHYCACELNGGL